MSETGTTTSTAPEAGDADVYVVTTPKGFSEAFDQHTIDMLVRLGLIRHERDDHILHDGHGHGIGALHHFYTGGFHA